jgi:hypothetical protein
MISSSRILLTIPSLLLALNLVSCVSDEEVRLTTDMTVEGIEMFNTSFALSEHINLLVLPYEQYTNTGNDTLPLPGCPTIEVNDAEKKVLLTFSPTPPCPNSNIRRTGSISLHYTKSLISNDETVLVEYADYTVRNIRLEGSRLITKRMHVDEERYTDRMIRLMVYDENESSTRINAEYEHQLLYNIDSSYSITSTGTGGGRNLAGRSFTHSITSPRIIQSKCVDEGIFVPNSGRESWTIERTVTSAVTHQLNFGESAECDNNVSVILSSGETFTVSP